jgi:transcriptional regulator with XRE-family HTH domain
MPVSDKEMEVASRLKNFREALNIKQKEVAEQSKTRQGQLSEMESGIKQIQPSVRW